MNKKTRQPIKNYKKRFIAYLLLLLNTLSSCRWQVGECGLDERSCAFPGRPGHGRYVNLELNPNNIRLQQAIKDGRAEDFRSILQRCKVDIDEIDEEGNKPLQTAIDHDNKEIVKILVQEGNADIQKKNSSGSPPLHNAISRDNVAMVKTLLSLKADVEDTDSGGDTPLQSAVSGGQEEIVKILVQDGTANMQTKDWMGRPPLHTAISRDNVEMVKTLLSLRANVEDVDKSYNTPLQSAISGGKDEIVKILVQEGKADINKKPHLHTAIYRNNSEMVKNLLELRADVDISKKDSNGRNLLHTSISSIWYNADMVKMLLALGADVEDVDKYGNTLLQRAVINGQNEIVKILVNEGNANVNKKYPYDGQYNFQHGWTILHFAAYYGHLSLVKYFTEELHLPVMLKSKKCETPLDLAIRQDYQDIVAYLQQVVTQTPTLHEAALAGDLALVQSLVASGTSVQLTTPANETALHYVAMAESPNIALAAWLLEQHITKDIIDNKGNTALSLAVERGHVDLVRLLMGSGASVAFNHEHDWTLLHLATYHGHLPLVQYFVEEAELPISMNKQFKTPLDIAIERNHKEIEAYLREFLLKTFRGNQDAMRDQLARHLAGAPQQAALQQLQEGLHLPPHAITPETLANQAILGIQTFLQGTNPLGLSSASGSSGSGEPKPSNVANNANQSEADDLARQILDEYEKKKDLLSPEQKEELQHITVEDLRPHTAKLVEVLEELRQLEADEIPAEIDSESDEKPSIQPPEEKTDGLLEEENKLPPLKEYPNTPPIGRQYIIPTTHAFIPQYRIGNVNRLKQSFLRLKKRLESCDLDTLHKEQNFKLSQLHYKNVKYILEEIQKEAEELASLYRDMSSTTSKCGGDVLFFTQDISQMNEMETVEFQEEKTLQPYRDWLSQGRHFLGELEKAQHRLHQRLLDKEILYNFAYKLRQLGASKMSTAQMMKRLSMQNNSDPVPSSTIRTVIAGLPEERISGLRNDSSATISLSTVFNNRGRIASTDKERHFLDLLRNRYHTSFASTMQNVGQYNPISTQDFLALLHETMPWEQIVEIIYCNSTKKVLPLVDRKAYFEEIITQIVPPSATLSMCESIERMALLSSIISAGTFHLRVIEHVELAEIGIRQPYIAQVAQARKLLLELQDLKNELCQIVKAQKIKGLGGLTHKYISNFENDYSDEALATYFANCGNFPYTEREKHFVKLLRNRNHAAFSRIMQKLGQTEPISKQDFVEALHETAPWDDIISAFHFTTKPILLTWKDRIDYFANITTQIINQSTTLPAGKTTASASLLAGIISTGHFELNQRLLTLEERIAYITPMILKAIIQSTPHPLGKTMQLTSMQEIQKRIHKLTLAIEDKLQQPILMLTDSNS